MAIRILLRRDTAANWALTNPVLGAGEVGVDTDVNNMKVGDGVTDWNSLAFVTAAGAGTLAGLVDTDFGALTDGQLISYDAANAKWVNTTLAGYDFDTDFALKTTTDLTEGTNLYYTDARARSAISVTGTGGLLYNATSGVITYDYTEATHAIDDITDISVTTPTNGQHLEYVTANAQWENKDLTITEAQIIDLQSYLTSETVTSLSLSTNILTYTDENGSQTNLDLSLYLDDSNLSRLVSGTLDSGTGIATFTRDDTTTFTIDLSSLLNWPRITTADWNTGDGVLTLTRGDATTVTVDLDGRFVQSDSINLDTANDVVITTPVDNQFLRHNGTNWVNETVVLYATSDFNTDFASKSTTDLSEGTNLYHTDARSRASISATGDVAYNPTTGVISYTEATHALNDLTDAIITTPTNGEVLKYNGTNWVNAAEDAQQDPIHPMLLAGL